MSALLMGEDTSNIEFIEFSEEEIEMCDIEVEDVHCYYANGILTHNSGQELRIAANLSREPVWIEAFKTGGDVHKETAYSVWGKENYDKEKRKLAKGVNFCETNSNFVYTDRGLVRPSNLLGGDKILNRFGEFQDYKMMIIDGEPCVEVIFSNGVVARYHENHKLLTWNGKETVWKAVKDIEGDEVIQYVGGISVKEREMFIDLGDFVSKNTPNSIKLRVSDPKFAYILGCFLGDGDLNGNEIDCVRIAASESISKILLDYIEDLGFSKEYTRVKDSSGCVEILFGGTPLAKYISSICSKSKDKIVPDLAFEMSDEWKLKIISGMLDSDGLCDTGGIAFCNTNIKLVSGFSLLCSSLGIRTSMYESSVGITENGIRRYIDKYGKNFGKCYNVVLGNFNNNIIPVNRENLKVHQDMLRKKTNIGWSLDKSICEIAYRESLIRNGYKCKTTYLFDNLSSGRQKGIGFYNVGTLNEYIMTELRENYQPIKIKSKKEVLDTIYAIEVPSHEYIASGCISHNSVIYGAEAVSFIGDGKTTEKPEGMSLPEAEEFFNKYKRGVPTLFQYQERLIRSCKQKGIVYTFFGRPRRVKYYFENRQIGFGKRTILNSPIQGAAGDVLKIVMCKLWKEVLNNDEYKNDVMFKTTVHDEINYGIRANRLNEIARKLEKTMEFDVVEWEVPLTVEVSFGWSWGGLFTFVWDRNLNQYVPKGE